MQTIGRIDNIAKLASLCNNGAGEMKWDSFDGREEDEYNSVSLQEIAIVSVDAQ